MLAGKHLEVLLEGRQLLLHLVCPTTRERVSLCCRCSIEIESEIEIEIERVPSRPPVPIARYRPCETDLAFVLVAGEQRCQHDVDSWCQISYPIQFYPIQSLRNRSRDREIEWSRGEE